MANFALLAPVPLEHLAAGLDVCEAEGKVAFGSRAWEVFREIDQRKPANDTVEVLIYASHADVDGPAKITWRSEYIRHVEGINGAHPDGMKYRPSTTEKYQTDNKGHWAVFWEVRKLKKLPAGEAMLVSDLQSLTTGKYYKSSYVPEGPVIIQNPW